MRGSLLDRRRHWGARPPTAVDRDEEGDGDDEQEERGERGDQVGEEVAAREV